MFDPVNFKGTYHEPEECYRPFLQKYRLVKLALYLLTVLDDTFGMKAYSSKCGTVRCAAGHSPKALGLPDPEIFINVERHQFGNLTRNSAWVNYILRTFGFTATSREFATYFGESWANGFNGKNQATARILYGVDSGTLISVGASNSWLDLESECQQFQANADEQFNALKYKYAEWLKDPKMSIHVSSDGLYIDQLPQQAIKDCSSSGDVSQPVSFWVKELGFTVDRPLAMRSLAEYGSWTSEELAESSDQMLAERVLWLACCNFSEWNGEADSPSGSDVFVLE